MLREVSSISCQESFLAAELLWILCRLQAGDAVYDKSLDHCGLKVYF